MALSRVSAIKYQAILQEIFNEKLGSKLMETRLLIHTKRLQKLIEQF